MEKLLYLVHRIPFPPNKGDKIRSFHWLKGLSERYRIYLGAFIDDQEDQRYVQQLSRYCEETFIRDLTPAQAKLKSLSGLLRGQALTLPYYRDAAMQSWVDDVLRKERITKALVYSSSMAQYLDGKEYGGLQRVIDFVDMDSDKWRQYAEKKSFPSRWIYSREATRLAEYEKDIANKFDASLFVSAAEADTFAHALDDAKARVDFVNNGVDTSYFDPAGNYANPFSEGVPVMVFTGAMDYWANVDAVKWFVAQVLPHVKQQLGQAMLYIVGSRPTAEVAALANDASVVVTGRVEDVRPYLAHCHVSVAPMRIARGIQNKVLEAMAMARPVVATNSAYEGIAASPEHELIVCDDPAEFAAEVVRLLRDSDGGMGQRARQCVKQNYSWQANVNKLSSFFNNTPDTEVGQ